MTWKSLFAGLLLSSMVLVSACSGKSTSPAQDAEKGQTATPASAPAAKKKVIGVSLPEQDNPFYVAIKNWLDKEGKAAGFEMKFAIANRDAAKQLADMEDFIQAKVDAIVLGPVDVVGSKAPVDAAGKANIPVVTVARYVQDSEVPISRIATDDVAVGRLAGEFIASKLGEKGGNVVMLRGPAGASYANLQEKGVLEVLAKNPKIKIVAKQAHPDTRADSLKMMEDILQAQAQIDAVYGSNDEVALGALAALKAANRKNVIVTGGNGIPAAIDSIKAGEMAFTAAKEPGRQSMLAIQALVDKFAGKEVKKDQFTAAVGVSKENVDQVDLKYTK